jgi:hypothetical protein
VFVRFESKSRRFETFLESADKVVENLRIGRENEKSHGLKPWSPCFYPKGDLDRLREQWERFGPESKP